MESDWELWAVRAPSARNLDSSSPAKNLSVEPETPWPWTSSTTSKASAVVTATTYRESATPSSSTTPFEESAAANASVEAQNHSGWLPDSEARRERTSSRHASKYSPFYVAVRWYVQDGDYVEVGGLLVELVRFIFPQHRALEGRDRPIDFSAEQRSSDIGENCETGETLPQVPRSGQQPLVRVGHVQIRSQVSGTVQHLAEIQSADILEFLETISEAALEKGQLLEFVHRFAESSSRIEPGQIIGTVRYCPHTTVYRGLCVNCQKDISTAEYLQLPSVEPEYLSYRGHGHELALAGGSTEEVLGCSERTTDLVGRAVCRTHVPLAYQNQQLIVSLRKAEELAKDNARRLLRERKLSLVLDLDHTLLHATNDPRAQQILHSLVRMLRVVLQHLQKRREWEEALLDRDTHSLEHLFEKLANAAEANGAELQHVFDEKEMSGTESATSVSDELLQALFDRLGIFAFTIGSNSVFSKYSLSGAAPAMNSLAIWNPVQAASTLTRSNHTGTQHGVTEAVTPVYYIKLRPGLRQFLRNVASRFELHIYTMGSRPYADAIASIIDPDKRLFQGRITSRDDFEDGRLNQKNLKHVFPCDDSMVLVVDDREDVWIAQDAASKARHFPNLIKARPYFFFRGLEEAYQRELQSISSAPSNGNDNDEMEATLTTDALSPNIGRGPLEARSAVDLPTGFTGALLFLQQWFAADRHDRDHLKRLAEILGECHENFFALYDKCIASEGAEGVLAGEEQVSRTLLTEPEPKKASLEYSDSPRGNLLADHMQSETARYGSASETQQENGRLALGRPCRESQTLAILDHAKQSEGFSKGFRFETEWKPAYEDEANVASGNPQISAQRYPEAGGDCAQSLPSESATSEDSMLQRYRLVTGSRAQSGHVSDSAAEQRPHHIDVAGLVWQRPVCASSTLPHGLELKSTEDARTDRLESSGHTDRLLFPTHITHGRNWRSDGARNDDDREYTFPSDGEGITAFSHIRRQSQLMLRDRRFSRSGDVIADQAPEIGVWLDGNCPSSILGTDGGGEFADGNQASSVAAEARSLRVVDSDGVDDENADDDDDDESVAVASPSPAPTVHHFTSLIGMQDDELDPELAKMQDAGSSGQSQTERHGISGSLASPESWESSDLAAQPLQNPDTMVLPGLDYGKSDVLVGGLSLRRSRRLAERRLRTSNEDSGELSTDSRSTTRATLGSTMAVMRSDKKRGAPSVEEDAGTR
ncbi:RNA polymerase II [Cyanidiococcus yangmingshanensis]|uniref:protein-serine/threonine phosphatase n=1 Tax=Cyanidiococcus yangmingshanensis TaxID=2690220 RepID=A0A7J7ILD4_9RHOD|nr:RNA polymerase II [Cyanidiococcus yangmingshanensis]